MVTTDGRCRSSLPSHMVVVGAQHELQHRFRVRKADIEVSLGNVRFIPKADIGTQSWNVRFVPKADIGRPVLDNPQQRVEDDQSGLSSLTQLALEPSQVLKQTGCSNRVGFAQSEFGLQVR